MIKENIKFVFFGTPERAAKTLEIMKGHGLVPSLIVTVPDKPQGRKMEIHNSPVKRWALNNNIPLEEPEKISSPEFEKTIKGSEWDLFVIVGYGKILPKWLLELPKHKSINVHYSLLPKYRGATPVETQILEGDKTTGVSIMLIDEEMDHGPILNTAEIPMPEPMPSNPELVETLTNLGGELLVETIPLWIKGELKAQEQDHSQATYTHKFSKEDGLISLSDNSLENFRKMQAFKPWPRTYFFFNKNGTEIKVIITEAEYKNGELIIKKVIPEGKKEMNWQDFLRGNS
jgi:methionyl-tRNA formyltransferase